MITAFNGWPFSRPKKACAFAQFQGVSGPRFTTTKSTPASTICRMCASITFGSSDSYHPSDGLGALDPTNVAPLPHCPWIDLYQVK